MTKTNLLGSWVRRFLLEHLVAERSLSANTQKSYRDMLLQLLPFIASSRKKPIDRLCIEDLSPQIARLYLSHIEQQRRCSISTRNHRLCAIHAFARFIGEHSPEHVEWYTQIHLIPLKKCSQPTITFLDKTEMTALLNAYDEHSSQGLREHAVLLFLYNSGARASEATSLMIGDIDWLTQSVRITGKGNKQRRCPLWTSTLGLLRLLVGDREDDQPVFLNRCYRPMTRSGIHTLVKRCAARAREKIPSLKEKTVNPHVIRHTTACHLLKAGVDINTIRGWLGHVSLTTTNIYAEIDLETKAKALAACDVSEDNKPGKRWREQPGLIQFLHAL
jgi:integrase/recombinase XerD